MIVLPERSEFRTVLADIIVDVCRCDKELLLSDAPFESFIEHFDSLAMLEILLGIETRYDVSTEVLLPAEVRSQEEMMTVFPKNLSELVEHVYTVVEQLNTQEQEKALLGDTQAEHVEVETATIERVESEVKAADSSQVKP